MESRWSRLRLFVVIFGEEGCVGDIGGALEREGESFTVVYLGKIEYDARRLVVWGKFQV